MNESLNLGETYSTPRKRRGKYCAAFDCNNSAYDVNGTRTSYHFLDFVVSTATVFCHEHFRAKDISKKLSGRRNLKTGLWYCRTFAVLLVCLCGNSAVCVHDLSYQNLRVAVWKDRESAVSDPFGESLIFCPKLALGRLFSKIIFKSSNDFVYLWKLRKIKSAVKMRSKCGFLVDQKVQWWTSAEVLKWTQLTSK